MRSHLEPCFAVLFRGRHRIPSVRHGASRVIRRRMSRRRSWWRRSETLRRRHSTARRRWRRRRAAASSGKFRSSTVFMVLSAIHSRTGLGSTPRVAVGEEAVALETARCHQDEHPERGVAEGEPLRGLRRTGRSSDRLLDVVVVDAARSATTEGSSLKSSKAGGRRWNRRRNSLYRGTPRSRLRRMSTAARSSTLPVRHRRSAGGASGSCGARSRRDARWRTNTGDLPSAPRRGPRGCASLRSRGTCIASHELSAARRSEKSSGMSGCIR